MGDHCAFADELTLLAALRDQDSAAFDYLVRTYHRRLLAVARRLLASEEDAHDAVQNAFLRPFTPLAPLSTGPNCRLGSTASSSMRRS